VTQLSYARRGIITNEMKECALKEGIEPEQIRRGVERGEIVILSNDRREGLYPLAIGKGLSTKINANIGTSKDLEDLDMELEKLKVAVECGADTVMDLSTGGDLDEIRKKILEESPVPVGTVPIYQAAIDAITKKRKSLVEMDIDDIFRIIERQAQEGVDFMTVHCGVTLDSLERLEKSRRIMGIVSRGGMFLVEWMKYNKKENPLYGHFDYLLSIVKEHDVILSLGDGFRPGCLADATDRGQVQELLLLGELTQRAWEEDVQVMIEGPGHMPMDQIEANVLLEKRLCHGAPFYVLGPLVTDIAPGYDHITSAIGGALAARAGADFLCYVTPSEHLRLPSIEDVRDGVIAAKIAAHAADIAKGIKGALDKDLKMAFHRKNLQWDGQISSALDPQKAKALRESSKPSDQEVCTMCGEFCVLKRSFPKEGL